METRSLSGKLFILSLILFFSSCANNEEDENYHGLLKSHFEYENKYAKGFKITAGEEFTTVEIYNPADTSELLDRYYLYFENQDRPKIDNEFKVFKVPVNDAALFSTTYASFFDHLDLTKNIKGIMFADLVRNEKLKEQIDANYTSNLSAAEELDIEKLIALNPDLLMLYPYQNVDIKRYNQLGIKTVLNLEHLESHPLARAEWIKLVGIFYGEYDHATEDFAHIEEQYLTYKSKVDTLHKPTVFTGSNYKGNWFAPGSDSFIASYIRDAGGKYVFEEFTGSENITLNFETAFEKIHHADYWGNVFFEKEEFTTQTLLDIDPRYKELKAIKEGNIFYCNTNESDYFGDAIMEPQIILADLISILHPESLPEHKNKYFFRVKK